MISSSPCKRLWRTRWFRPASDGAPVDGAGQMGRVGGLHVAVAAQLRAGEARRDEQRSPRPRSRVVDTGRGEGLRA
jgi:hypothetical protein